MNIILWIVFGGLAGWVATILYGNEEGVGILGNVIIGIIGACIGGFIADRLGIGGAPGADRPSGVMSFVIAVIGALVLLFLVNLLT